MGKQPTLIATARVLPKLCGADIELGNFMSGTEQAGGTGYEASRALMAEIKGLPIRQNTYADNWWSTAASKAPRAAAASFSGICAAASDWSYNPQDVSRRFLPGTGGCAYIDLNHAELCLAEVISAFDHVAAWHGMLRIMRGALDRANAGRPSGRRIQVLVNNSDGHGKLLRQPSQLPHHPADLRQHLLAKSALSPIPGLVPGFEHSPYRAGKGGL
jgi:hypothetical protein